jgi:hypothetical protein
MRDFLIHSYDSVDPERIDIPCKKLQKMLVLLQPHWYFFSLIVCFFERIGSQSEL